MEVLDFCLGSIVVVFTLVIVLFVIGLILVATKLTWKELWN